MRRFIFFTGVHLVDLDKDTGDTLKKQLVAWTELFNGSPMATKLTFITLPGNHKMLWKIEENKDDDEVELADPYMFCKLATRGNAK
jgi:hypothetical protein